MKDEIERKGNCMGGREAVLVAEDDENDICLLRRAFLRAGIDVPIIFVRDGEEAIRYLHGDDNFADRQAFPFPRLILLDIKMPKLNGFAVLDWVRHQPGLKRALIVVLTSSDEPADIDLAYDLGANSYLRKPCDFTDLTRIVKKLQEYWLSLNLCPNCDSDSDAD